MVVNLIVVRVILNQFFKYFDMRDEADENYYVDQSGRVQKQAEYKLP